MLQLEAGTIPLGGERTRPRVPRPAPSPDTLVLPAESPLGNQVSTTLTGEAPAGTRARGLPIPHTVLTDEALLHLATPQRTENQADSD